jgi:hypothetical protein
MSALAQCDAFAFIYDQAGDPAPDVLVVLKRVLDASGNPILLGPKTTLTDSAGSFHFTLPEFATAFISARASALWNCPDGRAFTVPPGPSGELVPDFSLPASTLVEPPLVYVGDVLSIPKASETQDGYLSAADFVRFEAGAADMGITQIDTGAGLTGGPITETGTIAMLPISGVAGTWANPSSITINAYGQVIAISGVADTTAPVISAIGSSPTGSGATITWTTDDFSDSQVEYGTTTGYGSTTTLNTTPVLSHNVSITGTPPSTLYHYRVKSRNTVGLLTTSGDNTFTTTAVVDTTPPVISAITATAITDTGATITWTTDDSSDSQVEYGLTTSYGSTTALDATMVTSHIVPITGTTATTLYHYRVKSRNAASLLTTSGDNTFTTIATPDVTPPVITMAVTPVDGITDHAATIHWTTNENADSQVEYGTTTGYGTLTPVTNPAPPGATTHAVALSGLTANTTYHYRAKSKDAAGNPATPLADASFLTAAAAPSSLLTGLRSYWKFEETSGLDRADVFAANNLTGYGAPASVAGKVGNAVYSGASAGWLVCNDNANLDFTGQSITIAGWMKIHSLAGGTSGFGPMISKWATTPQLDFLLWYRDDTHNFEFTVTGDGIASHSASVDIGVSVTLDQWYFLCAIYDRSANQISLSLNNAAPVTATFAGPSIWHSSAALGVTTGVSIVGDLSVDEIGIWTRVLTTGEITSLAAGITHPFTGTI